MIVQRGLRYASWAVLVGAPWLMLGLLSLLSGHDCFAGLPLWSDELDYWREMFSFAASSDGAFGYYGFDGYPAAVGEWGCHGVAPLLVYGPFALVFGWGAHSLVICNGFLCSVGILVFCVLVRPTAFQALLIALLWMTYLPLLLYAPSSMMELPQYACFFLYLAFLIPYARRRKLLFLVMAFLCVIYMAGQRLSNIVLFAPLVLEFAGFRVNRRFWALAALSLLASFACYKGFWLFSAGYPGGFIAELGDGSEGGALGSLLGHAVGNAKLFFSRGDGTTQVSQRLAFAAVFVGCIVLAVRGYCANRTDGVEREPDPLTRTCASCAFVLGLVWVIVIFAYDVFDWRDYRTLAPFLFATFMALVMAVPAKARRREVLVDGACILCTLALLIGAAGSLAGSAAFETERYDLASATEGERLGAVELEPVDDTPEGRTILLGNGTLPRWLSFGASPEIGAVSPSDRTGEPGAYGYVLLSGDSPAPEGYEPVWASAHDGLVIYRRVI